MATPNLPSAALDALEAHRGELFRLYNVENRHLLEVMTIMQVYGVHASRKQYNTKISEWGFNKNLTRAQVLAYLREPAGREQHRTSTPSTSEYRRPIDIQSIKAYCAKNRIDVNTSILDKAVDCANNGASWTIFPVQHSLTDAASRPSEQILFSVQTTIQGSFEAGRWRSAGPEMIINSALPRDHDKSSLHDFLGQLDMGCNVARQGNYRLANQYWQSSFAEIETIVRGRYHDHIPNLVQKINDLRTEGHAEIAKLFKRQMAHSASSLSNREMHPAAQVFMLLEALDIELMTELEDRIMKIFAACFEMYLGKRNYNAFVMRMNSAKRRLLQCNYVDPDECIPELSALDREFGPANRRSLDAIRLRAEILYHRADHEPCETAAVALIRRAEMISLDEDPWQRMYWLTKGRYYLGMSQYFQQKYASAAHHLENALRFERSFSQIESIDHFKAERSQILNLLRSFEAASRS